MRLKKNIRYIATPAGVFVTVGIMLMALLLMQAVTMETVGLFAQRSQTPPQVVVPEPNEAEQKLRRITSSAKECLPDGTIHLVVDSDRNRHMSYDAYKKDGYRYVRDLNDTLIWEGPAKECPYDYILWGAESLRSSFGRSDIDRLRSVSPDWVQTLEIPVGTGKTIQELWRFLPGPECFVGYKVRGERIGYIGANGFSESESKAGGFAESQAFFPWCPEDSHSPVVLWQTEREVYQINFENRKVTPLLTDTEADFEGLHVHTWGAFKPKNDASPRKYEPLLYCRTWEGAMHVVLDDPVRQITITPPSDWGAWDNNYCRFAATEDGIFMQRFQFDQARPAASFESRKAYEAWWSEYRTKPKTQRFMLYKVDEQGRLDLLNRFEWTRPAQMDQGPRRPSAYQKARYAAAQFSPPLYDILCYILAEQIWKTGHMRASNVLLRDFYQGLDEMRPHFGFWNLLLTALITAFAAWHALPRRKSQAVFVFWLVFVALFNIAGLLTYLALSHTPIIECSACGKRRGLNQPKCARCRAELPAPKPGRLDLILDTQPAT